MPFKSFDEISHEEYRTFLAARAEGRGLDKAGLVAGLSKHASERIIYGDVPRGIPAGTAIEIQRQYGFKPKDRSSTSNPLIEEPRPYFRIESDGLLYSKGVREGKILGVSESMHDVFASLEKISKTRNVHVVILGESGTGKELVAEGVHYGGPRRDRHYVNRNCAAIGKDVVESELFGHIKGAFTGASSDKTGIFRLGHEGTVFLDEITELPLNIQAKLLKAVENGHIVPVGHDDANPIEVDTRVIAATSKDIVDLAKRGDFRRDLLQRLAGYVIRLPSLRERGRAEIVFLADSFLKEYVETEGRPKILEPSSYDVLAEYYWPGNVRQLKTVITGAAISTDKREKIEADDIRDRLRVWDGLIDQSQQRMDLDVLMDKIASMSGVSLITIEAAAIAAFVRRAGAKGKAAESLQIARSTMARKVKEYQISDGHSYVVPDESGDPEPPQVL